jgi:hypothetical protein
MYIEVFKESSGLFFSWTLWWQLLNCHLLGQSKEKYSQPVSLAGPDIHVREHMNMKQCLISYVGSLEAFIKFDTKQPLNISLCLH